MPVTKLPPIITLTFDGRTVTLNPDENARYNLNALHKASGTSQTKKPSEWIRNSQTADLIEKLSEVGIPATVSRRGGARGNTGTWAIREVVFAYAEWISADFHKAVLETFSAAVDGDAVKAVETAQSVARTDGKASRRTFVSGLAKHGADRTFYSDMSDTVNLIVLGKTSSSMKTELGIKQYKPLRDHLPEDTLLTFGAIEALAAARMARNSDTRKAVAREIVYDSANDVKKLLGI